MGAMLIAKLGALAFAAICGSMTGAHTGKTRMGPVSNSIRVDYDLIFAEAEGERLGLDAYWAETSRPRPAVLFLHGGGWRQGDKTDVAWQCGYFARRGYACFSSNYRLAPKYQLSAAVEDVKAAVRWIRSNRERYNADPDRVVVLGASAGGHLAAMIGLTRPEDGMEGRGGPSGVPAAVQAVVCFFSPMDLRPPGLAAVPEMMPAILGGTYEENPEAYARVSPILYVRSGAPPFFFAHGTDDPLIEPWHSERMVEVLRKAGVYADLIMVESGGHGWANRVWQEKVFPALETFLESHGLAAC